MAGRRVTQTNGKALISPDGMGDEAPCIREPFETPLSRCSPQHWHKIIDGGQEDEEVWARFSILSFHAKLRLDDFLAAVDDLVPVLR
jgi:hypothetical protein